jgi:hypothetical protein
MAKVPSDYPTGKTKKNRLENRTYKNPVNPDKLWERKNIKKNPTELPGQLNRMISIGKMSMIMNSHGR